MDNSALVVLDGQSMSALFDAFGVRSVLVGTGVNGTALAAVPAPLRPTYRPASLRDAG